MVEEVSQKATRKISYSTFSLELARKKFQLTLSLRALFAAVEPVTPSELLRESLHRASDLAVISEKARAEFIVAPLLLEVREVLQSQISIYSGVRFDVAPDEGLQGICDFIITRTPPFPTLQTPLLVMVEAKRNIVEDWLGQCAAEMVAAQRVNLEENSDYKTVYGCVTTGEIWQFMQLKERELVIDPTKLYIEHLDRILGTLVEIGKQQTNKSNL